jgi:hypothetical protein
MMTAFPVAASIPPRYCCRDDRLPAIRLLAIPGGGIMKALAAILVCVFLTTVCLPVGSQEKPVIVQPKVQIHTGVVEPVEPAGPQSFGATLLLRFWIAKGDAELLAIELRCATPEFRAALTRTTEEGTDSFQIEGALELLRDREVLVMFDSTVSSAGKGPDRSFSAKGSVMLREGVPKALVTVGDLSLNARFAFDVEQ